jgi:ubiquinone/menaquinone biosynthesis C-methylase UbiE
MKPAPPISSTRPTVRHPDIIAAVSATPVRKPVAGNVYDKYGTPNPVVRRLMASFLRALDDLVAEVGPATVLDVGCGEGIVTRRIAAVAGRRVTGLDAGSPRLQAAWDASGDGVDYLVGDAQALPFEDDAFDLVSLVEMLQLVEDPDRALAEAVRVARSAVIVTVPHEPLWRALNVARGAYLRALGNTPGHLHHWSRRAIVDLVSAHARIVTVRSATPWTLILARPG